MSSDDQTPDPTPTRSRRRLVIALAAVAVALALVVAFVVVPAVSGGDADEPGAAGPGSGSSSSTTGESSDDGTTAPTDTAPPAAGPDTPEAPPVGLDESPTVVDGVTVRVKSLDAVDGEAALPGEVTGPAVRAELEVYNSSAAPVDLSTVVVNLAYGVDRTPANTFSTGTSSFPASVAAGATADGVYVFAVPVDGHSDLRLTFDYAVDVPVVVFEGSTS
ncbi:MULTISPECIES: hypothetical protein [unclassified Frigoribacterium]|uniref:hypothetical protein n=1 Tax=unclassified Frigoribacterium TaxID=2627005 RepID=UPI0006F61892|nr:MULTISPECIES: hypothetical protein [unclassified Frigoribacterium]KQM29332.1 hypothetical protein ASL10_01185 [Frigoribacterium sp. Leaf8]WAC52426.1 hypothetical protein OVA02_03910 [Frigoribacterium sp. SL97]